ncbi:hypothetical protein K491DRAFT_781027 [Lophiostoma macrostomum CBS 122681]|uniref:DUF6604 domain-containing protein n=1 Tax=Lophiostoma macrostomum CBS 122681 TaxID=1314788 RepID=A0A6A6T026_9PLEO|nr:hypothetical protein K491DRAFT_781027 [Lophiostoma macrostomum CBS 122681]
MLLPMLSDTYRRYKQDGEDIATWLVTTAKQVGYTADPLTYKGPTQNVKTKRLKGKARMNARKDAVPDAGSGSKPATDATPKYSLHRTFDTTDHGVLRSARNATAAAEEGHAYFLGILQKVRDVLRPLCEQSHAVAEYSTSYKNPNTSLDNIFAALTVEEPIEAFSNAPDVTSPTRHEDQVSIRYEVEPFDDRLESYLAIGAILRDCSKIRDALKHIWRSYAQGATSLAAAAGTTDTAIQMVQSLEDQFVKDHPYHSDTVIARHVFLVVQYLLRGQDVAARIRDLDPTNLTFYDLVESCYMSAYSIVGQFSKRLNEKKSLVKYKPGLYGVFDPSKDREAMSATEKFDEDRLLLLELLPDIGFLQLANRDGDLKATDALTRGVGLLKEPNSHTMTLDFSAQVHLDIQYCLRGKSSMGFADLREFALNAKASLQQNLQFHERLRVDSWPKKNDKALEVIMGLIEYWLEDDAVGVVKSHSMIRGGLPAELAPEKFTFFCNHPWLCGSLLLGIKLDMQKLGIDFLNAWDSAKTTAQIYNAVRKEKLLSKAWPDMDAALKLYGELAIFSGSRPDVVLARLISMAPDIKLLLARCLDADPKLDSRAVLSHKRQRIYTTPEALATICRSLFSEDLALTFDHFQFHRSCWRILCAIKDANAEELERVYGSAYLRTENKLPLVVGYILMTAVQTTKIGGLLLPKKENVASSQMLRQAASAIESMIDSGMGGLGIKTFREEYGSEVEQKVEEMDGNGDQAVQVS